MKTFECPLCGITTIPERAWRTWSAEERAAARGKVAGKGSGDGACQRCYRRRKATENFVRPLRRHSQIEEAMAAVIRGEKGCIDWSGRYDKNGYGKLGTKWAHRLIYEMAVGPIPRGLELDHLCRRPSCVNPDHLEPVTHAENMRRAGAAKTHCPSGHEYTPENTYLGRLRGERKCRACNRIRARANHAKSREMRVSA